MMIAQISRNRMPWMITRKKVPIARFYPALRWWQGGVRAGGAEAA
jgi:hypothetical protein